MNAERKTPLRRSGMSRRDWFSFKDRHEPVFHPIGTDSVTTRRFTYASYQTQDAVDWESEQWEVHAALIPLEGATDALIRALQTTAYPLSFCPSWIDGENFDFAESGNLEGLRVLPWIYTRKHPVSQQLIIEPRQDFLLYHALDARHDGAYIHPLDNITVLQAAAEQHGFYAPQPYVTVHLNYLRDYLAARRMGLLIQVLADRFANAYTESELELDVVEQEPIDKATWIRTTLHPAGTTHRHAMGRSSLYWNLVVEPYEHPKPERSPWPYFTPPGASLSTPDQDRPRFIADIEGTRIVLSDHNHPLYLYFKPHVLEKYLETPGYRVFFHMRTWGQACGPQPESCVDVGINSKGLATAFAADIARLNPQEQLHWAHYSSLPSGEWCRELVETRMQLNPPHSPGVIELITKSRAALADAYRQRFGQASYSDFQPQESELARMSVGPVRGEEQEVIDLAKSLYAWTVEAIQIKALRLPLEAHKIDYTPQAKQIVLLRTLLVRIVGLPEEDAKALIVPLEILNGLRVAAAHSLSRDLDDSYRRMGVTDVPATARGGWACLVDHIAEALTNLSAALR